MWQDDEDNNPYGSFNDQNPATTSNAPVNVPCKLSTENYSYIISLNSDHDPSSTPITYQVSPGRQADFLSPQVNSADEGEDDRDQDSQYAARKGDYDNRIQQILHINPDLEIVITDAGKSPDGSYIVYRIRTGVSIFGLLDNASANIEKDIEVSRRYSEFASLRSALVNLHPTLIIPPIPEKHTMADYAAKPTKAKEDINIIDLRKRMLGVFLNRCRRMNEVFEDGVWWRFLDPHSSWVSQI